MAGRGKANRKDTVIIIITVWVVSPVRVEKYVLKIKGGK